MGCRERLSFFAFRFSWVSSVLIYMVANWICLWSTPTIDNHIKDKGMKEQSTSRYATHSTSTACRAGDLNAYLAIQQLAVANGWDAIVLCYPEKSAINSLASKELNGRPLCAKFEPTTWSRGTLQPEAPPTVLSDRNILQAIGTEIQKNVVHM